MLIDISDVDAQESGAADLIESVTIVGEWRVINA